MRGFIATKTLSYSTKVNAADSKSLRLLSNLRFLRYLLFISLPIYNLKSKIYNSLRLSDLDFDLPERLIAQVPADVRDQSRLMVVNRRARSFEHRTFAEIGEFLPRNAVLMRNNASVLPARLRGFRSTGGGVELLLLHPATNAREWWCLARPGKKLSVGSRFGRDGEWRGEVIDIGEDGRRLVRFETVRDEDFLALVNRLGEMPLPPYIHREPGDTRFETDRERYQTVYAAPDKQVAAAAPTAGLHFTPRLTDELRQAGFSFADLTLHIGLGTFQPIKADRIEEHAIHREIYEMPPPVRELLHRDRPPPRVAVGTTVTRAVEDYLCKEDQNPAGARTPFVGEAGIFIYPPFTFRGVDALITNFHLPRSTLLCLVAAFLSPGGTDGLAWLKALYAEAIRENYRFFSYGDAMLIV